MSLTTTQTNIDTQFLKQLGLEGNEPRRFPPVTFIGLPAKAKPSNPIRPLMVRL